MFSRLLRYTAVISVILLVAIIWGANYAVEHNVRSQVYSSIDSIPHNRIGLLLGTAKYNDKSRNIINSYYQNRIEAAVALYMAGKIDYIIVSGDNSTRYYNEPLLMKNDLVARGVPATRIVMDNAGLRTLDSILRCRDVFGQRSFTIISQEFHNERALYIANHKGLNAVAYNAADGDSFWDVEVREKLARVRMMLDLIFNTQARFYGEPINIG